MLCASMNSNVLIIFTILMVDVWSMSTSTSGCLPHWKYYPRTYVAYKTPTPIQLDSMIDGDLNKPIWQNIVWSDPFHDIQGQDVPYHDDDIRPALTRFKAMYDDDHLYIGAILYPAFNLSTQAHFTQRNEPIYQKDSDFEVFIDTDGSNHYYKELEVNALNTIWNLMLDKPYSDGGQEHSGRIAKPGDDLYYEVYHQKTAVRILEGRLNDDNSNPSQGALWSVEMALAFSDLFFHPNTPEATTSLSFLTPSPTTRWRINFSRVERQGQINWTWQKQFRWDPVERKYIGKIDMHLPDSWGYVVFGGTAPTSSANDSSNNKGEHNIDDRSTSSILEYDRDPIWPARLTAMTLYYALHYHKEQTGVYTNNLTDLIVPSEIIDPFQVKLQVDIALSQFLVIVTHNNIRVQVTDDRLLSVQMIPLPPTITIS